MQMKSKPAGKSLRKKILVPLLGMAMAISSYSTAWAEPASQSATAEVATVQSGTDKTKMPLFWYCYYWYGIPYCYYYPSYFSYYYYWYY